MKKINLSNRGLRILRDLLLVLFVFFALKTYMQRELVSGVAPEISGKLLDESTISLFQYHGKPLLVHFWATWCSICNLEHSSIQSISQSYPVLSIAMESGNNQQLQNFMREKSINYPTIADENSIIAKSYGVHAVPTSFILNKDGEIIFTETGYTSEWGLRLRLWMAGL